MDFINGIMDAIADFIRYLRFTDGIASSDLIGWILAAIAGIIAYRLIDHMQTDIERHSMLADMEDSISELFDKPIALSLPPHQSLTKDTAQNHEVLIRSVLHDFTPWQILRNDKNDKIQSEIINNQRYIHIRDDEKYNEWISTQALHELFCVKIRRIEKMYKGHIVKKIDLSDLFREIVPLGMSGRVEFIAAYYDDYDTECLTYMIMQTIIACDKYHNEKIIKSFADYYNSHEEMHRYFSSNRRNRGMEKLTLYKRFLKILNKYSSAQG